jgi:arylformamidase
VDYEAEYNNRRRVPESMAIAARWQVAAAAYARSAQCELDVAYGADARQRYDLFHADAPSGALVLYIHGGYWQRGDRKDYSFVAAPFNRAGIDVAVASYSLCPNASIGGIVAELRQCVVALWHRTQRTPFLIGHSAGGHLTAALLATDWTGIAGVPDTLASAGCAISGVFELEPLIGTSLNDALRLDARTAREVSPVCWSPAGGRRLLAAVGELESSEFHRQSREIVARWGCAGVHTDLLTVANANHFTIIDELVNADSALFRRVLTLANS